MHPSAPTPNHRRGWALLAFGVTALGLTLGACSSTDTADAPRGDCPVEPVSVVATVNQWGQIVEQLGGDCVTVDSIISGSAADPHDYEPTPADSAAFESITCVQEDGRAVVGRLPPPGGLGVRRTALSAATARR